MNWKDDLIAEILISEQFDRFESHDHEWEYHSEQFELGCWDWGWAWREWW
jgi:hypothetical protein